MVPGERQTGMPKKKNRSSSRSSSPGSSPTRPASGSVAETLVSQEFLAAIPDAIVAVDQAGTIVQINSQTETLFRYTREELLGQKIEILVPERYRPDHHQFRGQFAQAPTVRRMGAGLDLFGRRRDGSEFPVEISLSPVSTGNGILVLSAIRDISDRRRIEEDLRRANEELDRKTAQEIGEYRGRLASIIDSSEDSIVSKDLNGIILSWNQGAEQLYGYTAEEAVGKPISILVPEGRPDEIPRILERIRRGESVEHYESVRLTKDGRHLDVSIRISPIRDAAGNPVGASAISRDITAQKRAEEHLRQAQRMDAIGRLAGGLAHDFNNILGIITACTELLRSHVEASEDSAEYVGNIRKAVDRGSGLTRQLLAFSKKQKIQLQLLDLNERLKETVRLLRPLMGDDVEIVVSPRSTSAVVEADLGQLDQVLINLAVNARDAMPHGGRFILETANVQLDDLYAEQHASIKPGRYVMLAVSDTGTGMDADTASRAFEPFFTTKETGKGTGLGLATVYGIVQQCGGNIQLYSELGRGTTFKIYLPSAEDKLGAASEPVVETVAPARSKTTILLVEDDEIMRKMTRKLLQQHGYEVVEAADGKAAVEWVKTHDSEIDLLLTDVVMRGLSGPELATQLGKLRPSMKVMFMSGYTGELIANHEGLSGSTLLEKPFTRATLLNTLSDALG
jgi:hypothetical protein